MKRFRDNNWVKAILRGLLSNPKEFGDASQYITWDKIEPGDKVILIARVSSHKQYKSENLRLQIKYLKAEMKKRGAIIIELIQHVGSGFDPTWLCPAARLARKERAKLVAESTSRLIRHSRYHSVYDFHAKPRDHELMDLQGNTRGVELVTLLNPNATAEEEREFQSSRGFKYSKKKTGKKRSRRKTNWPNEIKILARELKTKGWSYNQISHELKIARSTIQSWIKPKKSCTKT